MPTRKYMTKWSKEYLESGDIAMALLRTAADLEALLFEKLFFEKKIRSKLIENWTLGRFIIWSLELGLVDKKWEQNLKDFNKLRNKFVHRRVFVDRLKSDSEQLEKAKKLVRSIIDFIEQTEVKYKVDWDLEREYSEYLSDR